MNKRTVKQLSKTQPSSGDLMASIRELARLSFRIKQQQADQERLRELIKQHAKINTEYRDQFFVFMLKTSSRTDTKWKSVAEELKASKELVKKWTTTGEQTSFIFTPVTQLLDEPFPQ